MSAAAISRPAVCPACSVGDLAEEIAAASAEQSNSDIALSVPAMHCAGCISAVEKALNHVPGVADARVNLTLRRAMVKGANLDPSLLVLALRQAGYEAHELDPAEIRATTTDDAGRALLMRLGVAGFAMMNVMLLSVAVWSGAADATRDLFHWISATIALPTIAFSAQPFFKKAWSALRVGRLNMDVPISLAILLAVGMSIYETSQSGHHAYFDAALSLTFFLLAGRYLDHRTRHAARSAAAELAALEVPRALRVDGSRVPVAELVPGDSVRVLPGARMPVDGVVRSGTSEIDRSLLTGETLPVSAAPGQVVSAGEINLTGPLEVEVTSAGNDTSLRRLADLVAIAETARNRYTSLADKAARIYAPVVHLLALFAFVGWVWASGDIRMSMNVAVAVLIITCPCALGLAVPAVSAAASGRLYREGVLIKSATALERLAEVDTVIFDKTGTLTTGQPELSDLGGADAMQRSVALALAQGSAHPLSQALAQQLEADGVVPAKITDVVEMPGYGVEAKFGADRVRLGRPEWVGLSGTIETVCTGFAMGQGAPLRFSFTDRMRDGAAEAVSLLKGSGIDVILLSGDVEGNVARVAAELGIEAWEAGLLPDEKAGRVGALERAGRKALMVGDGLNDTGALAAAHVSMSPASALEAARVVADMVLIGGSLNALPVALRVARASTARIRENFGLAAAYNMVAIPIALAGFATPLAAALAMSASSITVSLNALRLQRK
jgi:Cu2+-exporting ATPase